MDSHWIINSSIVIGICLLTYAARPAYQLSLSASIHQSRWRALHFLICGFVVGYIALLAVVVSQLHREWMEPLVAVLSLGGAVFVLAAIKLSQQTLQFTSGVASSASYDSLHDHLTGIPNRRYFLNDLKQLINQQQSVALMMIDLNKFKQINDALGHAYGDEALKQVADRLGSDLSLTQKIYRLGGDEFAVLEQDPEMAEKSAENILEKMREPIYLEEMTVDIGASIGICCYPTHGDNVTTLLSRADMAMYESKRQSLGWSWFQNDLEPLMRRKLSISTNLRKAVSDNKLLLHFQPIFSQDGEHIHSVEALLRWPIRDGEFISPQEFIPIAEEERMVDAITNWVVQAAVRQLGEWLREGLDIHMNINLSALDLQDDKLWSRIVVILEAEGVPADRIILELTESAVMQDEEQALSTLEKISTGGAKIAIDDFGTGYSSMSRLKNMPIDQIKIDRCFIRDVVDSLQDKAIVNATVFLAKSLGCTVTAEGVETSAAASQLQSLGCDHMQGFYFARPQPAQEVRELLQRAQKQSLLKKAG